MDQAAMNEKLNEIKIKAQKAGGIITSSAAEHISMLAEVVVELVGLLQSEVKAVEPPETTT